ncbi:MULTISPECIES: DUF6225 family protein [unclassified Streptomyces]|uniref:DUF6225 family protein n=1 Tax=Streptomyces sp. R33 TaxID=3238629 RepID=A0AB39YH16_9ACTN|nr:MULTISPECIES: DUF6225 family protein [unclassified Streptomyces]KJY30027.1 hypothetical protein VR46_36585 [Streptomyces sp. NRRL S-444]KOY56678.1 hypothetical protein ADK59_18115 [Streptomyces sp. XY332]THA40458.1 hypothetical protein E6W17_05230 [Streptomyces sp. A1547]
MADMFDHNPQVWTAGRLREALAALPDETPIHIGVADGPGDFEGYGEYVLVDAEPVEVDLDGEGDGEAGHRGEPGPRVQFTLFADAAAGAYHLDLD